MILNILRGFCMALADSVPGVSGGTIAFLMGFYDKFIGSINSLFSKEKEERKNGIKFLLKLGIGWVIGMVLAASVLASVFDSCIYEVSSLFIGFIVAAIPVMIYEEKDCIKGKYQNIVFAIIGVLVVISLSLFKFSSSIDLSNMNILMILYIFVAGFLAISAMVLPGISGSTLLLSFGLYVPVITAVKNLLHLDFSGFTLLLILGFGIIFGVLFALKGIKKLLDKKRSIIIYMVIGMMIGSIFAIINGPTTLSPAKAMMGFDTFNVLFFIFGIFIVLVLQKIKSLKWYRKEEKKD